MAVYCGVCGDRLLEATENYGSFQTTKEFNGFVPYNLREELIHDACRECACVLTRVITVAANKIVAENADRIEAIKAAQIKERDDRLKADIEKQKFREEFERAWLAHEQTEMKK